MADEIDQMVLEILPLLDAPEVVHHDPDPVLILTMTEIVKHKIIYDNYGYVFDKKEQFRNNKVPISNTTSFVVRRN